MFVICKYRGRKSKRNSGLSAAWHIRIEPVSRDITFVIRIEETSLISMSLSVVAYRLNESVSSGSTSKVHTHLVVITRLGRSASQPAGAQALQLPSFRPAIHAHTRQFDFRWRLAVPRDTRHCIMITRR
jgi:hypothetical protein